MGLEEGGASIEVGQRGAPASLCTLAVWPVTRRIREVLSQAFVWEGQSQEELSINLAHDYLRGKSVSETATIVIKRVFVKPSMSIKILFERK